jgi:hypothetical protein
MIKRFLSMTLIVFLVVQSSLINATASTEVTLEDAQFKYYPQASKLSEVGVFVGTGTGFELYRAPNRLEALVVLIRLLGAEVDALAKGSSPCPFSDVPDWGKGYVTYAFENGLTLGRGDGTFGAKELITSNAYTTFMLRALGYNDSLGDFNWETSNDFALANNILNSELLSEINTESFIRNHMASISYAALIATMKAPKITLNEHLVNLGRMDGNIDVFTLSTNPSTESATPTEPSIPEIIEPVNPQLSLLGTAPISSDALKAWVRTKGMVEEGVELVDIYYELCAIKGLNPVIQYVQMCIETGWLYKVKSSAGIDASYHNPCGLKTTVGGGDYVASAHMRFDSWRDGIDAHTDHTALYAGVPGFPRADTLDPRHFKYLLGTATTVEQLTGKWASDPLYHEKILRLYNEALTFK